MNFLLFVSSLFGASPSELHTYLVQEESASYAPNLLPPTHTQGMSISSSCKGYRQHRAAAETPSVGKGTGQALELGEACSQETPEAVVHWVTSSLAGQEKVALQLHVLAVLSKDSGCSDY